MKSKPHSKFVIHATPLYGGPEDTHNNDNEEQLEMKTFGKSDTENKGILDFFHIPLAVSMPHVLFLLSKVMLCSSLISINMLKLGTKTGTSYLKLNML